MKASELQDKLGEIIEVYGDMEVRMNDGLGHWDLVSLSTGISSNRIVVILEFGGDAVESEFAAYE